MRCELIGNKIPVPAFVWYVYKSQISSWCPGPTPLTSPPTVNGPITVALVGKLSQIVGNLQFMIFPQINPSGTCLGEKFSTFWKQIFKKNQILREKSLHALDALHYFTISRPELAAFYDHCTSFNTAVYGRCISPTLNCSLLLHWVCHKIIWSDFFIKVTRWHGNGKSMELGGFSSSLVDIISSQGVWGAKLHLPTVLGFRRGQR